MAEQLAALLQEGGTLPIPIPIHSTALAWAIYTPDTETLLIGFTDGGSHAYSGVGVDTVLGLAEASSQGRYFNEVIRPLDP